MAIKIGHASIDENGNAKNGVAGDQNGKEVTIRTWYRKPWNYVLRCNDRSKAELMALACEKGCANPKIGYDQNQRNSLNTQAKLVGYDLGRINKPCECDCSSFMTVCAQAAGISVPYNGSNAPTTSTMKNAFISTGLFTVLSDSKYLNSDIYLRRGDILVKPGSHTVMALENGAMSLNDSSNQSDAPIILSNRFIDVSHYQGNVDWQKVRDAGIDKAVLKVVQKNLTPDPKFEEYYSKCKTAGIEVIGVYNYSYATTVAKAKSDAQKVLSILNGRKTKVWLDVEDKCQYNLGGLLSDIINSYQEVIESAGYNFGVYTGMSFYNSYIKPYAKSLHCNSWWIARYYNGYNKMTLSDSPNEKYNPKNYIGRDIYAWQYTSSGQVSGINGNVDINFLYGNVESNIPSTITETPDGFIGVVTASSLFIRYTPDSSSSTNKVGRYKKNEMITVNAKTSNGWYQTDKGYVSSSYVKQAIGKVSNCSALNLRSVPNSGSATSIIVTLRVGAELKMLSKVENWYKVKTNNGIVGYVSGKYITVV